MRVMVMIMTITTFDAAILPCFLFGCCMIPTIQTGHFSGSAVLELSFLRDHYPVMLVWVVAFLFT